ncbi:hypothetical protein [Homoserinibacter sp. YIM 151385]|uniref:hypothetical protein n=1 Tax=Homoserinibacter sp. YIM 151385 TaxID=2985506 RepID=UPI0022F11C9B|nr:hypothetical protein [Homoserinibacter sp. YIM 151385]WBU39127.1 hypothetical protein OF852_06005 [Homoserinibacter sp. YIM 151385]
MIAELFPLILLVIALGFAGTFLAGALVRVRGERGGFAARSRLALLGLAIDAAAALLFARELAPWSALVPWWTWLVPAAVVVAGVAASVLRWAALPWTKPGGRPGLERAGLAANLAVLVAIALILYLP